MEVMIGNWTVRSGHTYAWKWVSVLPQGAHCILITNRCGAEKHRCGGGFILLMWIRI